MAKFAISKGFLQVEIALSVSLVLAILYLFTHWVYTSVEFNSQVDKRSQALIKASNILELIKLGKVRPSERIYYKLTATEIPNFFWVKVKVPVAQKISENKISENIEQDFSQDISQDEPKDLKNSSGFVKLKTGLKL